MIDKKTNKQLIKSLKSKDKKPSWLARYRRKRLVNKLITFFKQEKVNSVWIHNDFVSGVEKTSKTIVAYVELPKNCEIGFANSLDNKIDSVFKRQKVNIIDVSTLLPVIKESIFKELTKIY